jgi:Flp pilus assembly protein TadB
VAFYVLLEAQSLAPPAALLLLQVLCAANNERKKQQAALQAAANEKRKAEAVRQESERRQKEFASKLNDIDKGFKRDWDSGKFMKEYRDPPMPRESRGGRETRVA